MSHWLERYSVTQHATEMVKLADNILRLILLFPLHLYDVTFLGYVRAGNLNIIYRFILEQFILTFRLKEFPGKSGRAMVIRGSAVTVISSSVSGVIHWSCRRHGDGFVSLPVT